MGDFSQSPSYKDPHMTGLRFYDQQQFLLLPLIMYFHTKSDGLIKLGYNFIADDPKHSAPRVIQGMDEGLEHSLAWMKKKYPEFKLEKFWLMTDGCGGDNKNYHTMDQFTLLCQKYELLQKAE